jgi:hypothetical protein
MFQEPRALLSRKPDKTQGILAGWRKWYVVRLQVAFGWNSQASYSVMTLAASA